MKVEETSHHNDDDNNEKLESKCLLNENFLNLTPTVSSNWHLYLYHTCCCCEYKTSEYSPLEVCCVFKQTNFEISIHFKLADVGCCRTDSI